MGGNGRNAALFLCGCGPNIAEHVDLDEIREWATERLGPTFIETHDLLCSPAGREVFRDSLANSGVDFAVVAACTPKMHELTFRTLAAEAGLNQAHVQIANLREQCAWVTKDRAAATEKAKALILAAFRRVELAEPLESPSMEVVTDLIVIGGGVAGIEAALTASQAGRKVTLVERDISLGGGLIRSEEVAPTGECSPCLLAPRLSAVRDDPNIEVVTNAEVTEVLGFYGNFTAKIRKRPRYVQDTCIGCAACFEECPVEVESSFHLGLSTRKAIHVLFPGSVPAAAAIDAEHCLHFVDGSCEACVPACPFSSIDFDEREEEMEISAGAVIVATGVSPAGVDAFPKLAHGVVEDVYTLPEFDRLACSNGPTGGKILTRGGRPPASVAFVHCAGSLREDGVPWCSGTCCAAALQAARLTRRQLPDAAVVQIHGDLVLPGPGHARLLDQAREEGVTFVRCPDVGSLEVESAEEGIWLRGKGIDPVPAEMVVLVTGVLPAEGTEDLAARLHTGLTPEGFFRCGQAVLGEIVSTVDGVYAAGGAIGPCDAATAVTRGRASAGDAVARLVPGRRIPLEPMTSVIDPERCAGCRLCLPACPYRAVSYDEEAAVCRINEAICRGCGTCSAGCPSGASKARHFTDEQIFAEIEGLVHG